jgi:hypothetical protein
MSRGSALVLSVMLSSWSASLGHATAPDGRLPAPCDVAADVAERSHQLPPGILAAIGRVESGRADPAGHVVPWPWTIDAAGAGSYLESAAAAVAAVEALQQQGLRNIDVGCFQVNLQQHPDAFVTLDAAFDPQTNADYAARFLAVLFQRTGTWDAAIAAYHSATPAAGSSYREQVFAQWSGHPQPSAVAAAPADQRLGGSVVIAGVRIWTPGLPGTAPRTIAIEVGPAAPRSDANLTK